MLIITHGHGGANLPILPAKFDLTRCDPGLGSAGCGVDHFLGGLVNLGEDILPWLWNGLNGIVSAMPPSWPIEVRWFVAVALALAVIQMAVSVFWKLWALLALAAVRRVKRVVRRRPDTPQLANARFATLADLKPEGMLDEGGRFLGQFKGRDLYLHGEGHCLTIAAPRSGKTSGVIVPTLLTYTAGHVIVIDPKGEITAMTMRFRKTVSKVIVLNPWRDSLMNDPKFGLDFGDAGANPMELVGPSPEGLGAATLLASLLLPDREGSNEFFTIEGRDLLAWGMLYLSMCAPPERRTLASLRSFLSRTQELTQTFAAVMASQETGPGWETLKDSAGKFQGLVSVKAGATIGGITTTATGALNIFAAETDLGRHVNANGFDMAALRRDEKLTIYLICPPTQLVSDNRKWLNLVLAMMMDSCGKPGGARETVMLMDEFPALGNLPNLASSMEQFQSSGLRVHLIAQNVGQIRQHYEEDGLARFFGATATKQFFAFADYDLAESVSRWCGARSQEYETVSAGGDSTFMAAEVPLIRASELTTMAKDDQIILRSHLQPIRAKVFSYLKRPAWVQMTDPNPYFSKQTMRRTG